MENGLRHGRPPVTLRARAVDGAIQIEVLDPATCFPTHDAHGIDTVTRFYLQQVREVAQAGGRIIVSPSVNSDVIRASVAAGLFSCPGYFTPSEGFAALDAGATAAIQPGGSLRDDEVIAAANRAGAAMVFTGIRHFRH